MKKMILGMAVLLLYMNSNAQTWSTTGNSGTTPPTNFLGTTDANALMFKVNKQQAGYLDYLAGKANTMFGFQALNSGTGTNNAAFGYKASFSNTTGKYNTSAGAYALYYNTTGFSNIAMGIGTLYKNTTGSNLVAIGDSALYNNGVGSQSIYQGSSNTAIGSKALYTNTTGSSNTAIGYNAMYSNTAGYNNVANGVYALHANTSGGNNVATGWYTLNNNTTGNYNVATGTSTLSGNTTGSYNTAYGANSLFFNQSGSFNTAMGYSTLYLNTGSYLTAIGYDALVNNTTGGFNVATGTYSMYSNSTGSSNAAYGYSSLNANTTGTNNTAIGPLALYSNGTGNYNTATGYRSLYTASNGTGLTANGWEALYNNTSGNYNTAQGIASLYTLTTGQYNTAFGDYALYNTLDSYGNTAIGDDAGASYQNGYYNCFIGANTDVNGIGYYNIIALGHGTVCTTSNQARVGNSATTSIGGYVGWSNISDGRVKRNIKQNVPGLAFINKLNPVTYNLDLDAVDKIIQPPVRKDSTGTVTHPTQQEQEARKAKEQMVYTGFVAQDVEKAAKSINYDFSGVDAAKNSKDLYGLRYAEFVVPLVKAVQELSKQNDEKDSIINSLENRLAKIEAAINLQPSSAITNRQGISLSDASLSQNIPNPFGNATTINYTLPQVYSSAKILITSHAGIVLKQTNLSGSIGSVTIDASTLSAGAYQYSLYVDGRLIDSKQMVLAK